MPCVSTENTDNKGHCFYAESLEDLDVVIVPLASKS